MRSRRPNRLAGLGRAIVALWMAFGISVATLAAIEIIPDTHILWKRLLRVFDPEGGKADAKAAADTYAGAGWTKAYWREYDSVRTVFAPYVHWRVAPVEGEHVNTDAQGLRRTWSPEGPYPAKPVRIAMFGGSTMFGMGARDDHTIPSELARRLAPVGPVEIVNRGQPGWVTQQELIDFSEMLRHGDVPDIVVFYDGGDDIFAAISQSNDSLGNRQREFNLLAPERRLDLFQQAAMAAIPRTHAIWQRLVRGQDPVALVEGDEGMALGRQAVDVMAATYDQIRALAASKGIEVRFFLQPVLFTKQSKTEYETLQARNFIQAQTGYAGGTAALRSHPALVQAGDVTDLTAVFDNRTDPIFVDFNHVGEAGNAIVAESMAGIIAPLVESRLRQQVPVVEDGSAQPAQ